MTPNELLLQGFLAHPFPGLLTQGQQCVGSSPGSLERSIRQLRNYLLHKALGAGGVKQKTTWQEAFECPVFCIEIALCILCIPCMLCCFQPACFKENLRSPLFSPSKELQACVEIGFEAFLIQNTEHVTPDRPLGDAGRLCP